MRQQFEKNEKKQDLQRRMSNINKEKWSSELKCKKKEGIYCGRMCAFFLLRAWETF